MYVKKRRWRGGVGAGAIYFHLKFSTEPATGNIQIQHTNAFKKSPSHWLSQTTAV